MMPRKDPGLLSDDPQDTNVSHQHHPQQSSRPSALLGIPGSSAAHLNHVDQGPEKSGTSAAAHSSKKADSSDDGDNDSSTNDSKDDAGVEAGQPKCKCPGRLRVKMAMSAIGTAMDLLFDATDSMDLTSNSLNGTADDLMKFSVSLGGFSGLSEGAADYLAKLSDWLKRQSDIMKRHSDITHGQCCELDATYSDLREVKGELSKLDNCDCAAMTAAAQDAAKNATNGPQAGAGPGSSKRKRDDEDRRPAKKVRSA